MLLGTFLNSTMSLTFYTTALAVWAVLPSTGALKSIDCTSATTLVELAQCYNDYTVLSNYYTLDTYTDAQPTAAQRVGWSQVITDMLSVGDNCTSVVVPSSLQDIYNVSLFTNRPDATQYCILSEMHVNEANYYAHGWGIFVVPTNPTLGFHLASPHPMFDFYTPDEAVTLFQKSGARSLLISGRHRSAYNVSTDCIPSPASTIYYRTDPTHDVDEPFSAANVAIRAWQEMNGGCSPETCAYIQLHGKASTSCSAVDMMVSAGLSSTDAAWYLDDVDRPAKRLSKELAASFPAFNVSLPSDTTCDLTATKNVFARLVNGVPESEVCFQSATAAEATGQFIHIEQAYRATGADTYEGWVRALVAAFSR